TPLRSATRRGYPSSSSALSRLPQLLAINASSEYWTSQSVLSTQDFAPDPFGDFVLFSFPATLTPRAAIALCIDDSVRFSRGVFSGSNSCDMPCLVTMRKEQ